MKSVPPLEAGSLYRYIQLYYLHFFQDLYRSGIDAYNFPIPYTLTTVNTDLLPYCITTFNNGRFQSHWRDHPQLPGLVGFREHRLAVEKARQVPGAPKLVQGPFPKRYPGFENTTEDPRTPFPKRYPGFETPTREDPRTPFPKRYPGFENTTEDPRTPFPKRYPGFETPREDPRTPFPKRYPGFETPTREDPRTPSPAQLSDHESLALQRCGPRIPHENTRDYPKTPSPAELTDHHESQALQRCGPRIPRDSVHSGLHHPAPRRFSRPIVPELELVQEIASNNSSSPPGSPMGDPFVDSDHDDSDLDDYVRNYDENGRRVGFVGMGCKAASGLSGRGAPWGYIYTPEEMNQNPANVRMTAERKRETERKLVAGQSLEDSVRDWLALLVE